MDLRSSAIRPVMSSGVTLGKSCDFPLLPLFFHLTKVQKQVGERVFSYTCCQSKHEESILKSEGFKQVFTLSPGCLH